MVIDVQFSLLLRHHVLVQFKDIVCCWRYSLIFHLIFNIIRQLLKVYSSNNIPCISVITQG